MDPNATLADLMAELARGDMESARESAMCIAAWILAGGFPPAAEWRTYVEAAGIYAP